MAVLTRSAVLICLLLVVSSAGSAQEEPEPKAEKACFRVRNARSLDAVDDRFVYVRCVRHQHYLLTMDNACLGLQNSVAVAVANGYDRVCSNDRAFITYREFDQTRRCGILQVEEVESREAALDLVKERKKSRPVDNSDSGQEKSPPPENP